MADKFEIGPLKFSGFGDRVLIQEDDFVSGYECPDCGGSGKSKLNVAITCKSCGGTGVYKGGLIIPDESQRKPTTGTIVSTGPECKFLKVGEAVLYSSYAGHTIDLSRAGQKVVLRILHETEVLCLIEGHLDLKTVRGKSEIAVSQG
jgi:co-chaperonin GroES (HSP10)